jgi:predicted O-methyltransferase YrrM
MENWQNCQYDDISARINYSMVRHLKPRVIVEFGARTGRCTHDILRALLKNNVSFIFKSYEKDKDYREETTEHLMDVFKDKPVNCIVGGDITKAKDIPTKIDYLFIDADHTKQMAVWYTKKLFQHCRKGALIQIHDWNEDSGLKEIQYLLGLRKEGKLPLTPLYLSTEYDIENVSSSWWTYDKEIRKT